jgi:GGDEF domain-containing protein
VRYGGGEFIVVLPGASLADVGVVGERIRRAIKKLELYSLNIG